VSAIGNFLKGRVRGVVPRFMPTSEQLETYFVLTARLTKMYVSVNLGTLDKRTQNVYVLAGEEIEIVIYPDGEWIFV
jgi:hypothetical protein